MSWKANVKLIVKKSQKRLYFLRMLKKFRLRREILLNFYRATIESVLAFSICVWHAGITEGERKAIDRVIKISSKILGVELSSLDAIFEKRAKKKADKILKDQTQVLF